MALPKPPALRRCRSRFLWRNANHGLFQSEVNINFKTGNKSLNAEVMMKNKKLGKPADMSIEQVKALIDESMKKCYSDVMKYLQELAKESK